MHLAFTPQKDLEVHWTNDAGNLSFFPDHEGLEIVDQQGPGKVPATLSTAEMRKVEFEVRSLDGKSLPKTMQGSAFYFVCEGAEGVCRYLRQDITISLVPQAP